MDGIQFSANKDGNSIKIERLVAGVVVDRINYVKGGAFSGNKNQQWRLTAVAMLHAPSAGVVITVAAYAGPTRNNRAKACQI